MEIILSTGGREAQTSPLDPSEHRRLAAILSRLASPYEGERATAALLASAFVARHDLQWADLVAVLRPVPKEAPPPGASPHTDRRRAANHLAWRGYCRRRRPSAGQSLDVMS